MNRHTIVPAVHLFLLKKNTILLARRFNTGFEDGKYSVPAGHVEKNETPFEAILREANEEIGINCIDVSTQFTQVMSRKNPKEEGERVDFFFICTKWSGNICNREPNKCDDLSWFALDQLPTNTIPYILFAVENYKKSIFYCEFGWENGR